MPVTTLRHSTGIPGLDALLGGGLLPGTLTVVVGATGIGKTQLGVQYAGAGGNAEGRRGVFFDLSVRGDAQSQADYAQRICGWPVRPVDSRRPNDLDRLFDAPPAGEYLRIFDYHGRKVARSETDFYTWHQWQAELNDKLQTAIAYLYGHLVHGVRRVVVDGFEPVDRPGESIQHELFEYVYQQVLRKDPEWVARDCFRQRYREFADRAARQTYVPAEVGCMILLTSREVLLDELISRPLDEGDLLSGANTVLYLGKIRRGDRLARALHIAKHRGSACDDGLVEYTIHDDGLRIGGG